MGSSARPSASAPSAPRAPSAPSAPSDDAPSATRPWALLLLCLGLALHFALAPPAPAAPPEGHFVLAEFGSRPLHAPAPAAPPHDAQRPQQPQQPPRAPPPAAARARLDAAVQGMEAALLGALGGTDGARLCSGYLAPVDPHEWGTPCDAACAREELDAFAFNFGAARVVDLSGGAGGAFAAAAAAAAAGGGEGGAGARAAAGGPVITEASLLRSSDGETLGSVALAVLAARAAAELKGAPALFLLPSRGREARTALTAAGAAAAAAAAAGGGSAPPPPPPRWVREELPALPAALRGASQEAFRAGLDTLLAVLSAPSAVLGALLPALAPRGAREPKRSSAFLFLPADERGGAGAAAAASGPEHALLGASDLSTLRALVCALAPGWSAEVQAGHLRVYAPLRAYTMPPRQMPPALWAEFTDHGAVPVRPSYYNQASTPGGEPVRVNYDNGTIAVLLWKAGRREREYYGVTDSWLYALLDRHPGLLAGKRVAVLGSLVPWYECIALAYGAGSIFTVEYGPRSSDDARFQFVTPGGMAAAVAAGTWQPFDVALSISSFEHDGLGRYGDPLSGDGDLATMAYVQKHVVRPGGHLLLAVPTGPDCLEFNEQRVYGAGRLPRILAGWRQVDSEGMDWARVGGMSVCEGWFQPVWLLQSPAAEEREALEAAEQEAPEGGAARRLR